MFSPFFYYINVKKTTVFRGRFCSADWWKPRSENNQWAGKIRFLSSSSWMLMHVSPCFQQEHWFEKALGEKKGFVIKKMKEDGACLFRAVGKWLNLHTSTTTNKCTNSLTKKHSRTFNWRKIIFGIHFIDCQCEG